MKIFNIVISLFLVLGASTVHADSIQFGIRFDDTLTIPGFDQDALIVDYMHDVSKNFKAGIGFRRIQRRSDNKLTNRFKLRTQWSNVAGVNGLGYHFILGTKEQTGKATTQYMQTQLQYGKRFAGSKFGWQVAYHYRQGILDASKYDDFWHGPRLQFNFRATDKITYKLNLDRLSVGYDQTPRNWVGFVVQRSI